MINKLKGIAYVALFWFVYILAAYIGKSFIVDGTSQVSIMLYLLAVLGFTVVVTLLISVFRGRQVQETIPIKLEKGSNAVWAFVIGIVVGIVDITIFHFDYYLSLFALYSNVLGWNMIFQYVLNFLIVFCLVFVVNILTVMFTSIKLGMVKDDFKWYIAVIISSIFITGPVLQTNFLLWFLITAFSAWLIIKTKSIITPALFTGGFAFTTLLLGTVNSMAEVNYTVDFRFLASILIILLSTIAGVWSIKKVK